MSMNEYRPDGWVIIEVSTKDGGKEYFVFGSWSGGYLDGDSWRLNSGISKVEKDGDYFLFHGFSGSTYRCSEHGEDRISAYNGAILSNILETHKDRDAKIVSHKDIKIDS